MMIDAEVLGSISVVSAFIGASLFFRYRVDENTKKLDKHLASDEVVHTSMVDRLARIETKIDGLRRRNDEVDK